MMQGKQGRILFAMPMHYGNITRHQITAVIIRFIFKPSFLTVAYFQNHIRGFLTEDFFKTRNDLPDYLRFALKHCLTNFLYVPDFVAYRFDHRKNTISTEVCRKLWKAQGVTWTLRKKEDYDTAVAEGWLPIFENFVP